MARLLKVLSQMERHEVRSRGAASDGGAGFGLVEGLPCLGPPKASALFFFFFSKTPWCFWDGDQGPKVT